MIIVIHILFAHARIHVSGLFSIFLANYYKNLNILLLRNRLIAKINYFVYLYIAYCCLDHYIIIYMS